ncbi:acyl-CoA-like ligand-binding transcription factor [Streptomyces cavernicola]|uniref:TetR family transcriptional regulator n=1 Tax=Streptomyces cavernicola TaxID=3043613 RepID=A0ABT6SBW8_9ACTN|nr:TetR family transcriptional regulator [Streptomyces sp. B-S-A6]MDI3405695.1 TetR family transcriptional regulator [Streptomyces sp. B-S-A6]
MPRPALDDAALLRISSQCADVMIAAGDASASVAELAAAAGISPRTFHRCFPTKADCLRPLLDAGNQAFAAALAAQPPGTPLPEALHAALTVSFTDRPEESIRRLMRLTFQDVGLRRVWLETAHETARLIRPAVAELTGTPVDDLATTVAAGQAVVAIITVLEHLVRDERGLADLLTDTVHTLYGEHSAHRTGA